MAFFNAYPNQGRAIREFPIAAAQDYQIGAPLELNASGEVIEWAGANPILGFSLHRATASPLGNFTLASGEGTSVVSDPDERTPQQLVALARARSTFIMQAVDVAGDLYIPTQADVGVAYDLEEDPDGVWVIDTDTVGGTDLAVIVERVFLEGDRNQLEVSVTTAFRLLDE